MDVLTPFINRDLPVDILAWIASIKGDKRTDLNVRIPHAPQSIQRKLIEVTNRWHYLPTVDVLKRVLLVEVGSTCIKVYGRRGGLKNITHAHTPRPENPERTPENRRT